MPVRRVIAKQVLTAAPSSIGTANSAGSGDALAFSNHIHAHGVQTDETLHALATASTAGFLSAAEKTKLGSVAASADAALLYARVCADGNQPLTGTVGAIDGVTLASGEYIFCVNQNTPAQNGLYVYNPGGAWSRAPEASAGAIWKPGTAIYIAAGTLYQYQRFWVSGVALITLGTTPLVLNRSLSVATYDAASSVTASVGSTGTSFLGARVDHSHAHGAQTDPTHHALATGSANGFLSSSDFTKLSGIASGATATPFSSTTPSAIGAAAAVGTTATGAARGDHTHAHGAQTDPTMHAVASGSANGFMSSADYTRLAGVAANADVTLTVLAAASAAISVNSQRITAVATPTQNTDAVNKAYVDAIAQGLDVKASCRVATLITEGSSANASGIVNTSLVVDGVTLTVGDRVLVKNELTPVWNGIYRVSVAGTGTNGTWVRDVDADSSAKVTSGMFTFVTEGATQANSGWALATPDPITLNTTGLSFTQFSGAGQINPGKGTTKSGNTLDVNANADGSIVTNADDIQVGVLATDAQHGNRGGGALHSNAVAGTIGQPTSGTAGFLNGGDKAKLDSVSANADVTLTVLAAASAAISVNSQQITNVATPTGANDAATKASSESAASAAAASAVSSLVINDTQHGSRGGGALHAVVVANGNAGFISGSDKNKLDGIAVGATATPFSSTTPSDVGTTSVGTTATGAARGDHVHAHGTQAGGALHAVVVAGGAAGFISGSDKTKLDGIATGATATPFSSTTPTNVGVAASIGTTATGAARGDHSHAHGAQTDGSLHAVVVASGNAGFISGVDKTKLDLSSPDLWARVYADANIALDNTTTIVDGRTLANGDRVLAGAQTSAANNGVYIVNTAGAWSRAPEAPSGMTMYPGQRVFIFTGDSYYFEEMIMNNATAVQLGTTAGWSFYKSMTRANIDADSNEGAIPVGASGFSGQVAWFARGDHRHGHGTHSVGTYHAVANATTNGFLGAADYVRLAQQGLWVKAATIAAITLSGTQIVDGYSLSVGDYVLVKDQADQRTNGLYVVAAGAWTRAPEMPTGSYVDPGASIYVAGGSVNGFTTFVATNGGIRRTVDGATGYLWFYRENADVVQTYVKYYSSALSVNPTAQSLVQNQLYWVYIGYVQPWMAVKYADIFIAALATTAQSANTQFCLATTPGAPAGDAKTFTVVAVSATETIGTGGAVGVRKSTAASPWYTPATAQHLWVGFRSAQAATLPTAYMLMNDKQVGSTQFTTTSTLLSVGMGALTGTLYGVAAVSCSPDIGVMLV